MEDFKSELNRLRVRVRLQMLVMIGALVILLFAQGGADVVARTLVESDAWTIKTKNLAGTLIPRIVASTDVNQATVKITSADLVLDSTAGAQSNLKLAEQTTAPATSPGKLWYDSTTPTDGKLKVYNGTSWVEAGGAGGLIRPPQVLTSGTSYTPPVGTNGILVILVGGGAGGGGTNGNGAAAGGGGSGATVQKYIASPGVCSYTLGSGGGGGGASSPGGSGGATTFTSGTLTMTAPGGSGAAAGLVTSSPVMVSPGGAGAASGTNGDINGAGAPGGPGVRLSNAGANVTVSGGIGGSTPYGGGGGPGSAHGRGYGSGGGGAYQGQGSGNGAPGLIIVYEYR